MIYIAKYWKYAVMAVLLALSLYNRHIANEWKDEYELCTSNREADRERFAAAAAESEAANLRHVRNVEQQWHAVTQKQTEEFNAKLTDARNAVAAYTSRVRYDRGASSVGGATSDTSVPGTSGSAPSLAGDGRNTLVPEADLYICADNTVKAKDWQDWYASLRAAQND